MWLLQVSSDSQPELELFKAPSVTKMFVRASAEEVAGKGGDEVGISQVLWIMSHPQGQIREVNPHPNPILLVGTEEVGHD